MDGMKEMVYRDALVDTLDSDAVITTATSIKDLPLMDITSAALDFQSPFEIKATKAGLLHGLVGYFDTLFTTGAETSLNWPEASECGIAPAKPDLNEIDYDVINDRLLSDASGKAVAFTTGPSGILPTHWKQTLFFFREPLEVEADMVIKGHIKCQKHSINPRELVIEIKGQLLDRNCSGLKKIDQTFILA